MKRLLIALVITALAVCGIICHKPPQEPEPTIIPETTCTTISTAPTENEETEPFSQLVTEPAATTEPLVLRPEQDATDCEQPVEERPADEEKWKPREDKDQKKPKPSEPVAEETKAAEQSAETEVVEENTIPTEPPTQATAPAETEATIPSQPVTQPQPEPEFEIDYWIDYAKSYARSLGLNLSADAVDCWDNPITAGAHCIYLERDIRNRLSRYSKDEDITDVWIWAVDLGNGIYDLYIGYA